MALLRPFTQDPRFHFVRYTPLGRARLELQDLQRQLGRRLSVEAELQAQRESHARAAAGLQKAEEKLNDLIHTPKAELARALKDCEGSIPDKRLAAYNQAIVDVFQSLEVRGEPRVAKGFITDSHYMRLELRLAGQVLWEQTFQTQTEEGAVVKAFSTVSDLTGISKLVKGAGGLK